MCDKVLGLSAQDGATRDVRDDEIAALLRRPRLLSIRAAARPRFEVRTLAKHLSAAEEEAAVRRLLQQDERLLLLAKHFGAAPGFEAPSARGARAGRIITVSASATVRLHPFIAPSVKAYKPDGPVPPEAVDRALEAAVLAPNHFLTQPWRYYLLGGESKAKLLKLNEKKAEEFKAVPGWMVVTIATEYDSNGLISTKKTASRITQHARRRFRILCRSHFCRGLRPMRRAWMTGAWACRPMRSSTRLAPTSRRSASWE